MVGERRGARALALLTLAGRLFDLGLMYDSSTALLGRSDDGLVIGSATEQGYRGREKLEKNPGANAGQLAPRTGWSVCGHVRDPT